MTKRTIRGTTVYETPNDAWRKPGVVLSNTERDVFARARDRAQKRRAFWAEWTAKKKALTQTEPACTVGPCENEPG